ncbi:alpha/beta hydrolase family protein [Intrasporangium sp.]|uniref:alpha/beta hydrolase family protein n=1 Tax=Intrasporangium sp. TaxID=1925024 RepID=UPI002939D37A|nr:prolyl oligopeptidase family serine peptidase [Intrasporangium sp.]MDV3222045.1 S9 family peptidase [Intrasporangium sp.]
MTRERDPHADDVLSRPAPPPHDTRPYAAGPAQVYDVRFPSSRPPSPHSSGPGIRRATVLVVHGGFWRAEYDRSHTAAQAAGLAEAGWHVAVGEYRRAEMPGGGWPGTFEDLAALVAAVAADRDLPGPLLLMGHSAGGHLVAWAANQPWADLLTGVVVLAGCVDLSATDRLHLGADAARAFLGSPEVESEAWRAADPMSGLPPRVPVRLVHGVLDREVPVAVTDAYLREAQRLGADVRLDVVPEAGHYSVIDPQSPAWPHVLKALDDIGTPS